jgi:spermidine synthase
LKALTFLAFFFSGASSLIFQSIWTRMLHLVFGSTSVAQSSVLCVFMGGLGLGAWLFGRYADRIRRPLLTYALVEVVVGLFGLLVPHLVAADGWLATVNATLRGSLGAESPSFLVVRFLCIVPILIVPTVLMGATLPLLARHFVVAGERSSRTTTRVGALYAVNTFGAVAGIFAAGFLLLPAIGLYLTNLTACTINFGLASAVTLLVLASGAARRPAHVPAPSLPDASDGCARAPDPSQHLPRVLRRLALGAFAVSGAVALCYEVVWTRALAMTIGSSIYSFTLILMTFLIGIASGSAIVARTLGKKDVPLGLVTLVALLLSILANVPAGVAMGIGHYLAFTSFTVVSAAGLWAWRRRASSGKEGARAALVILAVPAGASVLNALGTSGDLARIVASVVGAVTAFVALNVLLRRRLSFLLGAMPVSIALATVVGYVWQDDIPRAFGRLALEIAETGEGVGKVQFFMFVTVALSVLPATLGMGAMFPLTLGAWTAGGARIGRDVGVVYSVNTIGAMVGAWLPGFLLLPVIGMEHTLQMGIAANLLIGVVLLLAATRADRAHRAMPGIPTAPRPVGRATGYGIPALLLGLGTAFFVFTASPESPLRWDRSAMTLGVFRLWALPTLLPDSPRDPAGSPETPAAKPTLVYYRDGVSTTVSVDVFGDHVVLRNNGKPDASTADMPTQITLGVFPLLLHPRVTEPLDVAVIGWGSGVTVASALTFPVRSVDVIELERAVVEASRHMQKLNRLAYTKDEYPYLEVPRLKIINDDGRNYLAAASRPYDVIISEPSNPWITGVSDLFTSDHFRIAKRRLRSDGIFCQWVQLYELSPENIKTIFRTFASEFEHVLVLTVEANAEDTMMIGSSTPISIDLQRLRKAYTLPGVADELKRAKVLRVEDLYGRVLLGSKDEVMAYSRIEHRWEDGRWVEKQESTNHGECPLATCRREPVPLNTDDNALIELRAPRDLIGNAKFRGHSAAVFYSDEWPYGRLPPGPLPGLGNDARAHADLAISLLAHGRKKEAKTIIDRLAELGEPANETVPARLHFLLTDPVHEPPMKRPLPSAAGPEILELTKRYHEAVAKLIEVHGYVAAVGLLDEVPELKALADVPEVMLVVAYLLFKAWELGRIEMTVVLTYFQKLLEDHPELVRRYPSTYYYHARVLDRARQYGEAVLRLLEYIQHASPEELGAATRAAGDGDQEVRAAGPASVEAATPRKTSTPP